MDFFTLLGTLAGVAALITVHVEALRSIVPSLGRDKLLSQNQKWLLQFSTLIVGIVLGVVQTAPNVGGPHGHIVGGVFASLVAITWGAKISKALDKKLNG